MKFNLKNYWREILIGILIALLLWVSSADRPVRTIGNSDTICHTDTINQNVPVPVRVGSRKIYVTHYDTVYANVTQYDTTIVDHIDTSWLYADVPVQEYTDTSYFIRTIGWLDSVSVYMPKCVKTEPVNYPPLSKQLSIFANTHLANGVVAPGVTVSVKRLQLGYNWNLINQSGVVTIGYRIR